MEILLRSNNIVNNTNVMIFSNKYALQYCYIGMKYFFKETFVIKFGI